MRSITTRACVICRTSEPNEPQDVVLNVLEEYVEPPAGVMFRKREDVPPKLRVEGQICASCYHSLLSLPPQ
jgi:hypothetical protein